MFTRSSILSECIQSSQIIVIESFWICSSYFKISTFRNEVSNLWTSEAVFRNVLHCRAQLNSHSISPIQTTWNGWRIKSFFPCIIGFVSFLIVNAFDHISLPVSCNLIALLIIIVSTYNIDTIRGCQKSLITIFVLIRINFSISCLTPTSLAIRILKLVRLVIRIIRTSTIRRKLCQSHHLIISSIYSRSLARNKGARIWQSRIQWMTNSTILLSQRRIIIIISIKTLNFATFLLLTCSIELCKPRHGSITDRDNITIEITFLSGSNRSVKRTRSRAWWQFIHLYITCQFCFILH